jgi:hypothetical protein
MSSCLFTSRAFARNRRGARRSWRWVPAVLAVALCAPASTLAGNGSGHLEFSQETVYRVTITTSFDFQPNSGIPRVQVSHGLPVERPWSKGEHKSSGRDVKFEPTKGKIEHDRRTGASFISWEERVPAKGGPMVFTTTYETTSVARSPSPEAVKNAKWKSRRVRAERGMHPEIVEQAQALIKEPSPLEAFKKFSEWLQARVSYDASVPNTSVDDTMSNGAGHCGHRAAVLREFIKAVGLEARSIGGFHLTFADGGTDKPLFKLRPTWSNTHAWTEVDIPGIGWVEMEPVGKDKIFDIPADYVQTRGNFQNYQVRVMRGGKWVRPEWETVADGDSNRFVSDIGLSNVIKFEVLSGPDVSERQEAVSSDMQSVQVDGLTSAESR